MPAVTPIIKDEVKKSGGGKITMDFPGAIKAIIRGKKVTRLEWPKEDHGLLKDGWLMIYTKGQYFTWKVNDGDLKSNDWVIYKEKN